MKAFWQRLSRRERNLVFATAAILIVFAVKVAVLTPFLERREWLRTQLEIQPQLLAKNVRYLNQAESLRASLEAARARVKAYEGKLLGGDTASVSASDLQDVVQGLATREGTQVITTRVLNPEPAGAFAKVAIQMEIGGQIQQLASLIRSLETSPKLLVIDEITVRSLFRPAGFPQVPGAPQPPAQNLRAGLTVSGFARGQPSGAAKGEAAGAPAKTGG